MLHFYLLGRVRLEDGRGDDLLPPRRKARALLAYVRLAQGVRVPRGHLASLLWDRSGDEQARSSLRQELYCLTSSLRDVAPDLLHVDRHGVMASPRGSTVDYLDLLEAGDDAFQEQFGSAMPLAPESFLAGLDGVSQTFDRWLDTERLRFSDQVRRRLERMLGQAHVESPGSERVIGVAEHLLQFEPENENAACHLMRALASAGERVKALRVFDQLQRSLTERMDAAPSAQTLTLYEDIRSGAATMAPGVAIVEDDRPVMTSPSTSPGSVEVLAHGPPMVAVVPLRCSSAGPESWLLAEGLVDDIIESLARVPSLQVISRLSTLEFRDRPLPPRTIGGMLRARYVLSGSVRVAGDRIRVVAELTDCSSSSVSWACKIDERAGNVFDLQDRVSDAVVSGVAPRVHAGELRRIRAKRPETLQAYELLLRAIDTMHKSSREVFETSRDLFAKALDDDPRYAAAHAWLAYWHVLRVGQGWSDDPGRDTTAAERHAREAIDLDELEPMAFAVHGHVISYLHKDFDLAFDQFSRAVAMNPSAAPAWLWSGAAHAWSGEGPRAIEHAERAIGLTPYNPLGYAYSTVAGMAYLVNGQAARAVEFGNRSVEQNPTYTAAHRMLVVALMLEGREEEARRAVNRLLELEPGLTVSRFRARYPGNASAHAKTLCDALESAGVPAA